MKNADSLRDSIKKAILRKSVVSIFLLVALWNLSISSTWLNTRLDGEGAIRETLREIRDTNLHIQMRFYQLLTLGRPIGLTPEDIRLVYIDDQTHWTDQRGANPTDRTFLASLILNASQAPVSARAIGLDVELLAPRNFDDGDDEDAFIASDRQLQNAIATAATRGVPIVLASTFYPGDHDHNLLAPNIYGPQTLEQINQIKCLHPRCVTFGYINLPADKRQIPLNEELATETNPAPTLQDSFAVALAKAVRGPTWVDDSLHIEPGQPSHEEVFGTFLPESRYIPLSALSLAQNNASELTGYAGRILLIGGHWRELQGHGSLVDAHLSPAGTMSGLGLHANYLASILDLHFAHEPPLWVGILVDLVLGLIIYTLFEIAHGWKTVLLLALTALIPIVLAYACLVTANLYLDFLLPIELYFLHILYELAEHTLAGEHHDQATPIAPTSSD